MYAMNTLLCVQRLVALMTLATCSATMAEPTSDYAGNWAGYLEFRGDKLALRLEILSIDGDYRGALDIPELVYANQPLPIKSGDTSLLLELPFGIGEMSIALTESGELQGGRDKFNLSLERSEKPARQEMELGFGAVEPRVFGTLTLPAGQGPHPVIVIMAGSGNANRERWSYSSWVDFYLRRGIGTFIYDRRPDADQMSDGQLSTTEDHAADVLDAIALLKRLPAVDADRMGVSGSSRGAWIAMSVASQSPDLAFLILSSPAATTPAEQETTSVLTGMRQDGVSESDIAAARTYLRLYFYVAATGEGWNLLASSMEAAEASAWYQYVDQPRTIDDLNWWRVNMNFEPGEYLQKITMPVLAMWGGNDFITPYAEHQLKLLAALKLADNSDVTALVFDGADHRLEVGFGENENGDWHWFGIAPGALKSITEFVNRTTN